MGFWRFSADDVIMMSWRARVRSDVGVELEASMEGQGGGMWGPRDDVEGNEAR